MKLLFLDAWFSGSFVPAFCWTLVHSLWQGMLAAFLAALVIAATRRSTAALRYNLLSLILFLFLLASVITFFRLSDEEGTSSLSNVSGISKVSFSLTELRSPKTTSAVQDLSFTDRFTAFFNTHAYLVALAWFLFFSFKCLRLAWGLKYIRRIRYRQNTQVPLAWRNRLEKLAERIGMRKSILFLQSELVKVPVAIGMFKPMILVPVGLLTHLPAQQVEAILLHELAHIRRRDYAMNLIQTLGEAFFFFNPGLLWISSLIREEREACCDDMVVAYTPSKAGYLEALVYFQEYTLVPSGHAMALGGRKNYLLNRVNRLVIQENKKLNSMEKSFLLISMLVITAFGFMPGRKHPAKTIYSASPIEAAHAPAELSSFLPEGHLNAELKKIVSAYRVPADTVPDRSSGISAEGTHRFSNISSSENDNGKTRVSLIEATDEQGKKYMIRKVNGEITQFSIDGKQIPEEEYNQYSDIISEIEEARLLRERRSKEQLARRREEMAFRQEELKARQRDLMAYREALEAAQLHNKEVADERQRMEIAEQKQRSQIAQQRQKIEAIEEIQRLQEPQLRKKIEATREGQKADEAERSRMQEEMFEKQKELRDRHRHLQEEYKDMILRQKELREYQEDMGKEGAARSNAYIPGSRNRSEEEIDRLIEDLRNEQLVKGNEPFSFTLNNKELVVNGSRQPAEIHQRLKEKYIHQPGDLFSYQQAKGSTQITIHRED